MDELHSSFKAALDALPKWDRQGVLDGGLIRESFIRRMEVIGITHIQATLFIEYHNACVANDIDQIKHIQDAITSELVVHNKHNLMLTEVEKTLAGAISYCGRPDLTKTEILKFCKKDKGEWRKVAGDSLKHLVATGKIVKVGARYHHQNHRPKIVENDFTRNVFESLYSGPKSINAIVKRIGYDNTYGRRKVRQTLDFLVNEGLVLTENYRWSQNGLD
tara:strand:- start:320 stop:976 length:657 start_codon:yes stop_codon:yes gene_type:complete